MEMIQPLGPDAIRERIAQIQGQMGMSPDASKPIRFPDMTGNPDQGGLSGTIGKGSTQPLDPFGGGMGISGKPTPADLKGKIQAAALRNGVDPALLDAVVQAESDYDPNCVSSAGAKGLTQLMPFTASGLGVTNPFDPDQSLQGGAKYLSQMMRQFPNIEHAIAAYNAGPGAVMKAGGIPNFPETRAYVQRVMALFQEKKG